MISKDKIHGELKNLILYTVDRICVLENAYPATWSALVSLLCIGIQMNYDYSVWFEVMTDDGVKRILESGIKNKSDAIAIMNSRLFDECLYNYNNDAFNNLHDWLDNSETVVECEDMLPLNDIFHLCNTSTDYIISFLFTDYVLKTCTNCNYGQEPFVLKLHDEVSVIKFGCIDFMVKEVNEFSRFFDVEEAVKEFESIESTLGSFCSFDNNVSESALDRMTKMATMEKSSSVVPIDTLKRMITMFLQSGGTREQVIKILNEC